MIRIFVPTGRYPWTMIGQLSMTAGGSCTATLIGADVLITAAHCIHGENGQTNAAGEFIAHNGQRARITHYLLDPNFDFRRFNTTDQIDGLDWALLRLDRRLGAPRRHRRRLSRRRIHRRRRALCPAQDLVADRPLQPEGP